VTIAVAQRDMWIGLMGGFMGQLVSGLLWLASAAFATWGSQRSAITVLVVAGFFIFPLTRRPLSAKERFSRAPEGRLLKRGHWASAHAQHVRCIEKIGGWHW
jgi:hypothetical protein